MQEGLEDQPWLWGVLDVIVGGCVWEGLVLWILGGASLSRLGDGHNYHHHQGRRAGGGVLVLSATLHLFLPPTTTYPMLRLTRSRF